MKALLTTLLLVASVYSYGQLGISYHQSNLSFAGVNYQLGERFLPEFRMGANVLLDNFAPELVINYQFVKKEDYQVYAGLGGRIQIDEGIVLPLGVNIYPFENKQFGFQTELATVFSDNQIFRGSWGIRYHFK